MGQFDWIDFLLRKNRPDCIQQTCFRKFAILSFEIWKMFLQALSQIIQTIDHIYSIEPTVTIPFIPPGQNEFYFVCVPLLLVGCCWSHTHAKTLGTMRPWDKALTTRWSVGTWVFGTRIPPYRPSSRYHSTSLLHQLHLGHGVTHRRNMNDSLVLATTMCLDLRMSFCERSLSDQPWSPHDGAGPCQNLLLVTTGILRLHQFHAKKKFPENAGVLVQKKTHFCCVFVVNSQ